MIDMFREKVGRYKYNRPHKTLKGLKNILTDKKATIRENTLFITVGAAGKASWLLGFIAEKLNSTSSGKKNQY